MQALVLALSLKMNPFQNTLAQKSFGPKLTLDQTLDEYHKAIKSLYATKSSSWICKVHQKPLGELSNITKSPLLTLTMLPRLAWDIFWANQKPVSEFGTSKNNKATQIPLVNFSRATSQVV